jgi:hypothetical protein
MPMELASRRNARDTASFYFACRAARFFAVFRRRDAICASTSARGRLSPFFVNRQLWSFSLAKRAMAAQSSVGSIVKGGIWLIRLRVLWPR